MRKIKFIMFIAIIILLSPVIVNAGPGCCSWHGGQSYCGNNGRWICDDGWESSCWCSNSNTYDDYEDNYNSIINNNDYSSNSTANESESSLPLLLIIIFFCLGIIAYIKEAIQKKIAEKKEKALNKNKEAVKDNTTLIAIIMTVIIVIVMFIILIFNNENTNSEEAQYNEFVDYVFETVIPIYVENKEAKKFVDERVYIKDLYEDSNYYYNFYSYYDELINYVEDDYVVLIENNDDTYSMYYYETLDEIAEFVDYIKDYAIVYYQEDITNNYELDIKDEQIDVTYLVEKGYIKSKYIKNIYKNIKEQVKNDYVDVVANNDETYDVTYYFNTYNE